MPTATVVALIITACTMSQSTPGVHHLTYASDIDDSIHDYVLYLPKAFNPNSDTPYPIVFFGVGYGGKASPPPAQYWADTHNWIFVSFDGRRTLHYYGIAERDFQQLLFKELAHRYSIDLTRVFFMGSSMGASGAFGLGFRHPHWFTSVGGAGGFLDLNEWYPRWCEPPVAKNQWATTYNGPQWRFQALLPFSTVHTAETGLHLKAYIAAGQRDPINRTFASQRLAKRLTDLNIDRTYVEVPNGKHGAGYNVPAILEHFRTQCPARDPLTHQVSIASNRLEFARNQWATIDALFSRQRVAKLKATLTTPNTLTIETTPEVHAATFDITPALLTHNNIDPTHPQTITIDGAQIGTTHPTTLHILRATPNEAWKLVQLPASQLRKRPGVEGPVNHIFETPLRVVYGKANKQLAHTIASTYNRAFSASIKPIPASQLTDTDRRSRSLVLIGNEHSNPCLAQAKLACKHWPFTITNDTLAIAGLTETFSPNDHALCAIHPSPWNPQRYVLIVTALTDASIFHFGCFAAMWLPDYIITNTTTRTVQHAGYFNEQWKIPALDPFSNPHIIKTSPTLN